MILTFLQAIQIFDKSFALIFLLQLFDVFRGLNLQIYTLYSNVYVYSKLYSM